LSSASIPAAAFVRRKPPASVRRRRLLVAVANHSLLIATATLFIAPFVFIFLTSVMTNDQALSSHLWPHPFRWQNFADVFHKSPLWRWTLNSMIYMSLATLGLLLSSIPVAYALSRIRWRGRNAVFMVVLMALMLPPQVSVVPLYVMWAKLHLVGTLWPLIIPNWLGDAFSIFLLRQFFLTIPRSLASPPWRCSRSCTRSTTSSCRCCTRSTRPTTGRCRSGSRSSGRSTRCSGT
jgi:multiple sugar transport system permease protein